MNIAQKDYNEFVNGIKSKNRFIIDENIINLFNIIIKDFSELIREGEILYRGRINSWMNSAPFSDEELGMPPFNTIGRVNPYGMKCMYLSEDVETVIAELRPNRDSLITIGEYKACKDIRVIKLSDNSFHNDEKICDLAFLLGLEYSRPVDKNNDTIDYLPTQYFAELCKSSKHNVDGIKYLSSVMDNETKGCHYNLALFNSQLVKCVNKNVHRVLSISYEHSIHVSE